MVYDLKVGVGLYMRYSRRVLETIARVRTVQGGRQVYLPLQQGDTFDHQVLEYAFDDGIRMFAQTRQLLGCWTRSTAKVLGAKGSADLFGGRIEGANPWRMRGKMPNPYQIEHDVLMDAIRRDKPHNEVEHAAAATLVGIMGRAASYFGQKITWEQVMNSQAALAPERYAFDAGLP